MSRVLDFKQVTPEAEQPTPFLVFSNPGTLEMSLVKLLGVSVKESNDPIGFFGTGLKYAMATALRLGGEMTIHTGGERYDVRGRTVTLRDKEFTQVYLNDEPLGFTTELGKQWEAWMVVRELYSNALDEQGETTVQHRDPVGLEGKTAITLHGESFLSVWENRQRYFLSAEERCHHRSAFVDAYDSLGHNHAVFYRGIKIHDTQLPTLHRYNLIDKVTLTEDRTLRYQFHLSEAVEKSIISSDDPAFIAKALTAGERYYEGTLGFCDTHSSVPMSDAFRSVCSKLNARRPKGLNMAAIRWYQARTMSSQPLTQAKLTAVQQMQLSRAVAFVKRIGFDEDLDRYPVRVVNWLGEGVYGKAADGTIVLSKDCFDKGTKFLASTILEEFVHCHYDLADESRELQTWLFDRMVTMGEEYVTGEPL